MINFYEWKISDGSCPFRSNLWNFSDGLLCLKKYDSPIYFLFIVKDSCLVNSNSFSIQICLPKTVIYYFGGRKLFVFYVLCRPKHIRKIEQALIQIFVWKTSSNCLNSCNRFDMFDTSFMYLEVLCYFILQVFHFP